MIRYTQGNLLDDPAEALVNTVNTVGVMGKGIALMFKEAFPANYHAYAAACKAGQVRVGQVFATRNEALMGPRWIINFPTKQHWRGRSQMGWIRDGLDDLVRFVQEHDIRSIAVPPLGSGNGGLHWPDVRTEIEQRLGALSDEVEIVVYEPTRKYQNVAKRAGVKKLTPARALIAELVREYAVLGFECSLLEIQKLAWLLERSITRHGLRNVLDLRFHADKYGPYAPRLTHLLNALDGSYLHCDKCIPDAGPLDVISFDANEKQRVATYLHGPDAKEYLPALAEVSRIIDGFQSPLGMELLATVDWLVEREGATASTSGLRSALEHWPAGRTASQRKQRLFTDQMLSVALQQLSDITATTPA